MTCVGTFSLNHAVFRGFAHRTIYTKSINAETIPYDQLYCQVKAFLHANFLGIEAKRTSATSFNGKNPGNIDDFIFDF